MDLDLQPQLRFVDEDFSMRRIALTIGGLIVMASFGVTQVPVPCGPPISLERAKMVMAAPEAEANGKRQQVIAVVDTAISSSSTASTTLNMAASSLRKGRRRLRCFRNAAHAGCESCAAGAAVV
jgi:hypothetical protein